MTTIKTKTTARTKPTTSRVLVVDSERTSSRCLTDVCAARGAGEVVSVKSLAEARKVMAAAGGSGGAGEVSLVLVDVKLPDGTGLALIPELRRLNPNVAVVVTSKLPKVEDAIEAMRCGANDFLAKPFTTEKLAERISEVMEKQGNVVRREKKIGRLKDVVRRLAESRRTVAKKVDLLCNDLVGAYGELSKQVDSVRVTEDFRKICAESKDLEQLLCHAMDWMMRRVGYSNIAVYLAAEETFQLGAYVKYTMPSTTEMTDAMRDGIVARAGREGFVKMNADEAAKELTAAELRHLRGQAIVAANCTYLGESLATIVLFRDSCSPYTTEDAETFRAIAPVLAIALAGQVRTNPEDGGEPGEYTSEYGDTKDGGGYADDEKGRKKEEKTDADWWKRGEAPPF